MWSPKFPRFFPSSHTPSNKVAGASRLYLACQHSLSLCVCVSSLLLSLSARATCLRALFPRMGSP